MTMVPIKIASVATIAAINAHLLQLRLVQNVRVIYRNTEFLILINVTVESDIMIMEAL